MKKKGNQTINKDAWEIVKIIEQIVKDKEYWTLDKQETVKEKVKKLLKGVKENENEKFLQETKTLYYLIKVTAYMNFEASLRMLSILDEKSFKVTQNLLEVSKRKSISEYIKEPELTEEDSRRIKGESEIVLRRFKLILAFDLIDKLFNEERRDRIKEVILSI